MRASNFKMALSKIWTIARLCAYGLAALPLLAQIARTRCMRHAAGDRQFDRVHVEPDRRTCDRIDQEW